MDDDVTIAVYAPPYCRTCEWCVPEPFVDAAKCTHPRGNRVVFDEWSCGIRPEWCPLMG